MKSMTSEDSMESSQKVTLTIPEDILRKAKMLAGKKNISLDELLTQALVELVSSERDEESYERARKRNVELLQKGFNNLGSQGTIPWSREDLHER
jgi:hypothetical protein